MIIGAGQIQGARRTSLHPLGSLDDHAYILGDAGITTLIIDPVPSFVQRALRSEEHTSELQSPCNLVCRLLLEKKNRVIAQSLLLLVLDRLPVAARGNVADPALDARRGATVGGHFVRHSLTLFTEPACPVLVLL